MGTILNRVLFLDSGARSHCLLDTRIAIHAGLLLRGLETLVQDMRVCMCRFA